MQPISRRTFLALGVTVAAAACSSSGDAASPQTTADVEGSTSAAGSTTAAPATSPAPTTEPAPPTTPSPVPPPAAEYEGTTDPFALGVASGDPLPESVVLWTRLLAGPGELITDDRAVLVTMEAEDEPAGAGSRSFWVTVSADDAHTVHAVVDSLEPDRWYTYRFESGGFTSATGRTRTTPADDAPAELLVVGSASCQNYEDGFYAAHDNIAAAGLDLLVWLGDYIYESGPGTIGVDGTVRVHDAPEPTTLDDYRARYAFYKRDPSLQAAHAACPWLVTWDDHEVENNYAGTTGQAGDDLSIRRLAAYRAWWEHTPTRLPPMGEGSDNTIYRPQRWGTLADISVLDTRQYRSVQACGNAVLNLDAACPETFEPDRTLLGTEQEAWLFDRFGRQGTTWNVIAQQVVMTNSMLGAAVLNYDQWDGYPAQRDRLLQHVSDNAVPNVVVLTGDIHFAGVGDLVAPSTGIPEAPVIGAEFVTSSISSGGRVPDSLTGIVLSLPDIVDVELAHRGWIRHTVTPESWTAEYRIVTDALDPASESTTFRSYAADAGRPGARPVIP